MLAMVRVLHQLHLRRVLHQLHLRVLHRMLRVMHRMLRVLHTMRMHLRRLAEGAKQEPMRSKEEPRRRLGGAKARGARRSQGKPGASKPILRRPAYEGSSQATFEFHGTPRNWLQHSPL